MEFDDIKEFKCEIVDVIMKVATVIVAIGLIFLSIRDYPALFSFQAFVQYFLFLTTVSFYVFRNKVPYVVKTNFIVWGLFLIMIVGLVNNGFIAAAKAYLILAPGIAAFVFSYKRSVWLLVLFFVVYLIIGYLHTDGVIVSTHNLLQVEYNRWLAEAAIYVFGSYTLLYLGNRFRNKLYSSLFDLERNNEKLNKYSESLELTIQQRTEELEKMNEDLIQVNQDVLSKNETIEEQNKELNLALKKLTETQKHLLENEKMALLGVLTAGIAHEIKNPLNYLVGAKDLLEVYFEENSSPDEEQELLITSIGSGIERITSIVQGLNRFSRNNNRMDETCDIHSILDDCLMMLNGKMKSNINLKKIYCSKDIIIKGNVGKMHQVFINVLVNAIQAIRGNGNITVLTAIEKQTAIIKIMDDGVGIAKKIQEHLTHPFFTTKSPEDGTGLGLSITNTILQEHNGNINFDSMLNEGTTVIITLPLKV